jgi:hypothetical protein
MPRAGSGFTIVSLVPSVFPASGRELLDKVSNAREELTAIENALELRRVDITKTKRREAVLARLAGWVEDFLHGLTYDSLMSRSSILRASSASSILCLSE